ncbi:MAG: M15 family metallopeptidase [Lacibacter sp.]|jgi:D-alanyl-D-alanine dipeptidase
MDAFQIFKIVNQLHIARIRFCFFLFLPFAACTQQLITGKYGVATIQQAGTYKTTCKTDSNKRMIELKSAIPNLVYDLRYSTEDNFVKQPLYPRSTSVTFLRLPAANALTNVQKELAEKGMGLKIFDAYRPYSVTVKFWELIKDERYVANPAKGSGHNRGLAIDLTIVDLKTGKELDMGTGFDNFTDTAHHTFTALPQSVLQNRKILKEVMLKHGFKLFETEWWHYSWPNDRNYEVLDLSFEKLLRLSKQP